MEPDLYAEFLDLPPGPRPPNHYAILLLPNFAPDRAVIHEAVLSQNAKLRRWALHPHRETRDRVQDMLNELGMADFILGDPKTKAEYDRALAQKLGVPLPAAAAAVPPPAGPPAAPRPAPPAASPRGYCPRCGAATRPGRRFCTACGRDLRAREAPERAPLGRRMLQPIAAWVRRLPVTGAAIVAGLAATILTLGIVVSSLFWRGGAPPTPPPPEPPRPPQVYTAWPFDAAEAKRRQEETARALRVKVEEDVDLGGGVKLTLVLIPAGRFTIGSPATEAGRFNKEDQKEVTIDRPFWIGKYEVTQAQWQAVVGSNPSRFTGAKNPVECVSWNDIQEGFLAKLNRRATGDGFAMPTEAQWEYACRAGSAGCFCFGDGEAQLGDYAWYDRNSQNTTHAACQKRANAWGLHDMHGNVWEWCASPYAGRYDGSEQKGAEAGGNLRVLRGGSWFDNPSFCRSAFRYWLGPGLLNEFFGFRVVLSVRAFPQAIQPPPDVAGPIVARVEKAVAAKDTASAEAGLAELRKADPNNPRRAELDARVEEIRPKPPEPPKPPPPPQVYVAWPFDAAEAKRRQEETARALRVEVEEDVDLGGGVRLTLVIIPAGRFTIGSPATEAGRSKNEDQKEATIDRPFWIGKYEVTQEQWRAMMGSNPSQFQAAKNPVASVSWNDIQQGFLPKLNGRVASGGFALPTEAQWEYACRAGTATRFSFGDEDRDLDLYAWHEANSGSLPHPVGGRMANRWGLHDMHGNVWEWVASPYVERYDGSEQKGAEAGGRFRVFRGGSWLNGPRACRSAMREWNGPVYGNVPYGFRVVRSASAPE